MKKIILVLCAFLLTGCKSKLVCTLESEEQIYKEEQKITFNFDDNKVKDVKVNYTMTFDDEETAKTYLNIFESLDENYEVNLDRNKIDIKSYKNYEQYDKNKDELRDELEKNGYLCK